MASPPRVGELELAALEHLWEVDEATVAAVHVAIGAKARSLNTVGSALERLHRKGLVARRKVSHAYVYAPTTTRERFHARRMAAAAGGAEALRDAGILAAFVDTVADVDEETLDALAAAIRRRKRRGE